MIFLLEFFCAILVPKIYRSVIPKVNYIPESGVYIFHFAPPPGGSKNIIYFDYIHPCPK